MSSHTSHSSGTRAIALAVLATLTLACESEVTAPEEPFEPGEVQLDATSATDFAYLSLETGSVVSVSNPSSSTEWDIAFRRFSVKLNGGVAGPGGVTGFNVGNHAAATSDEVLAFTPATGDAAFESVTESAIASATFAADGLIEDGTGSWFRFSPQAGTLVANPGAAWRVREADGGYALFRVAALQMAGQAPLGATIEFRHQAASGTLGATGSVVISFAQGAGHVDLSSGTVVQPNGCNWDLRLTPAFAIEFNTACNAGSFPLDATEDFTALVNASGAPEYGPFLAAISGAIPNTVDDASGVFWYNILGDNRLSPTFNVFLVKRGEAVYKVQVTDYYNATGASGFPTIRYLRLR